MATNINDLIFIKRVKKAHHDEGHGGAWKIAYADFVTAMMAFFLLMWLLNSTTEAQRTGISNYFAPASVSQEMSGAGGVLGGRSIDSSGASVSDHTSPRILLGNPSPILGNAKEESEDMVGSFTQKGTVDSHNYEDASGSHMGPLSAHDQEQGDGAYLGNVDRKTAKDSKSEALGAGEAPKHLGPGEGEGVSPVKGDKQGFDARQGPHDNTEFDPTIAHGDQQSLANEGVAAEAVRQRDMRMPQNLTADEQAPYRRHMAEEKRFSTAEQALKQALANDPVLKKYGKNFKVDSSSAGLRIQMVDDEKNAMFPLGSADMIEITSQLLEKVAAMVAPMSNKIVIAGHTDSIPYRAGSGYGNWELSTDRAHAARRALVEAGVSEDRIVNVSGKAATDPLIKADPKAAGNRRISILLMRENTTAAELNRDRSLRGATDGRGSAGFSPSSRGSGRYTRRGERPSQTGGTARFGQDGRPLDTSRTNSAPINPASVNVAPTLQPEARNTQPVAATEAPEAATTENHGAAPEASGAAAADNPATADVSANKIEHQPADQVEIGEIEAAVEPEIAEEIDQGLPPVGDIWLDLE